MPEGGWRKEKVNDREILFLIQNYRFAICGGNVISWLQLDQRAILKPIWFLVFSKTKSWLQLYSGKIVFGKNRKLFCDVYKTGFSKFPNKTGISSGKTS
jgi:hypothetical protein